MILSKQKILAIFLQVNPMIGTCAGCLLLRDRHQDSLRLKIVFLRTDLVPGRSEGGDGLTTAVWRLTIMNPGEWCLIRVDYDKDKERELNPAAKLSLTMIDTDSE